MTTPCNTMLKPALATTSGTVKSLIVLNHVSDLVSNVCSNVSNHALDVCVNTVAQRILDRMALEPKHVPTVNEMLTAKAFSCHFLTEKTTIVPIPSAYTASKTYLGTIAQPRIGFISKQRHVTNLQSAREAPVKTAEHSPPYPSTSTSWTKSDMGSMRMLCSSTMVSEVLLKLLSARQSKYGSCN